MLHSLEQQQTKMKKIERLLLHIEHLYENLTTFNISVFFTFLIPVLVWIFLRRHFPPGPFGLPFVGNFHLIGNPSEFVRRLLRFQRTYGNVFRLNIGSISTVVVLGHDMIREALIVKGEKFKFRPDWLYSVRKTKQGGGITWNNGQQWQKVTSLSEMFVSRYVSKKGLIDNKIQEEIQRLANDLYVNKSRPINMRGMLSMAVFNIVCELTLGERSDFSTSSGENLSAFIDRLSQSSVTELPENYFMFMRMFYPGKTITSMKDASIKATTSVTEKVNKHKETLNLTNIKDICDIFLKGTGDKEEEKLTDDTVVQALIDIMAAGYGPTTSTLTWAILFMVRYQEIQEKCRAEIKQALAPGRPVTWNDKEKLPFTTATIHEVQRLANTVPLSIPHTVQENTELGRYKISRNSLVLFHLYSSHMDPTYWKRPQEFRPEHFLDLDGKLIQHDAFFPYGLGIRSCPFFDVADRIIFLFFANLMRKFFFEKEEGHPAPSLEHEDGHVVFPNSYYVCPRPHD